MGDLIESVRHSQAYGPVGILAGAGIWYGIKVVLCRLQMIDVRDLMNSFLAIMFSGIYIYLWVQGENPHDGELKPNELPFEIPLLLAGAAYVNVIYPFVLPVRVLFYLVSVAAILNIMYSEQGATIGNVYAFLYHVPEVIQDVSNCLKAKKIDESVTKILGYLYALVFVASMGGMIYTTCVIVGGDAPSVPLEVFVVLYTLLSLGSRIPTLKAILMGGGEESGRRRGRSRSARRRGRSKSACRSKSRSRSRSRRKRRC